MSKRGINWKYQIEKISDYGTLNKIKAMCEAQRERLWRLEEEAKITHLKSLPTGTVLLVKFHQLANQRVELIKHGRKYARIRASDGQIWQYPYRALTDKLEDKLEKMTAETNQMMGPVLNAMNKHIRD